MKPNRLEGLLTTALGGPTPELLERLLDLEAAAPEVAGQFILGPIFPFSAQGTVRLYVSSQIDPARWDREVRAIWPHPQVGRLLDSTSPEVRRMVDTDGGEHALFYVDDLQLHGETPSDDGGVLMCECVRLPEGRYERVTRHRVPPGGHLSGHLATALDGLLSEGASGFYALRWVGESLASLLWITESARLGTAAQTVQIIERIGRHPRWHACLQWLADDGLVGYPDAVEFFPNGTLEVHLGISTPEQQAPRTLQPG